MWIIFLLWIILDTIEDYGYLTNKNRLWHIIDATTRTILSGYIFYLIFGIDFKVLYCTVAFLFTYWIIFDPLLNKLRGKQTFYIGTKGIDGMIRTIASKLEMDAIKLNIILKTFALISIIVLLAMVL